MQEPTSKCSPRNGKRQDSNAAGGRRRSNRLFCRPERADQRRRRSAPHRSRRSIDSGCGRRRSRSRGTAGDARLAWPACTRKCLPDCKAIPVDIWRKSSPKITTKSCWCATSASAACASITCLPFTGQAHIAYLPSGKVVGLSKLARVVEEVSRRPQVQERLTQTVADLVEDRLSARGVAVVCEATHSCMTMRGVRKPGSLCLTSAMRGIFRDDPKSRAEVLGLINRDA